MKTLSGDTETQRGWQVVLEPYNAFVIWSACRSSGLQNPTTHPLYLSVLLSGLGSLQTGITILHRLDLNWGSSPLANPARIVWYKSSYLDPKLCSSYFCARPMSPDPGHLVHGQPSKWLHLHSQLFPSSAYFLCAWSPGCSYSPGLWHTRSPRNRIICLCLAFSPTMTGIGDSSF